jgi:hypothetical protein
LTGDVGQIRLEKARKSGGLARSYPPEMPDFGLEVVSSQEVERGITAA